MSGTRRFDITRPAESECGVGTTPRSCPPVRVRADSDEPTGSGRTPLVVAEAFCRRFGAFRAYRLDRSAKPISSRFSPRMRELETRAISICGDPARSDPALVKALLAHGADPNARIETATPVGRSSGDYALTLSLIGATPFWQAASYNDVEIMRALLAGGADPGLTTPDGTTALAAALRPAGRGDRRSTGANERTILEAVELIVGQHVDVDAADDTSGDTPLHIAATAAVGARGGASDAALGFPSIVRYLVDKGADLHAVNHDGHTPLATAIAAGPRAARTAELLRILGTTY